MVIGPIPGYWDVRGKCNYLKVFWKERNVFVCLFVSSYLLPFGWDARIPAFILACEVTGKIGAMNGETRWKESAFLAPGGAIPGSDGHTYVSKMWTSCLFEPLALRVFCGIKSNINLIKFFLEPLI